MNVNNLAGARLWERFLCSSPFLTPQNVVTDFQSVCLTVPFLFDCLHGLFINEFHSSGSAWESSAIFFNSSEVQYLSMI